MKNKEVQGQRMRGYFLAATKELLKAEGLKSVSVRSIADKAGYSSATVNSLKVAIKAYTEFFIQYPGVFELFFIEKMGDLGNKKSIADLINSSLDQACEEEWNYCITRKLINVEEVERIKAQIRYTVFGLLLLYLNRRVPSS